LSHLWRPVSALHCSLLSHSLPPLWQKLQPPSHFPPVTTWLPLIPKASAVKVNAAQTKPRMKVNVAKASAARVNAAQIKLKPKANVVKASAAPRKRKPKVKESVARANAATDAVTGTFAIAWRCGPGSAPQPFGGSCRG